MKAFDLLNMIPEEHLDFLAEKTNVNYQTKKLTGQIIFKMILMTMLESNKASLRIMEGIVNSPKFKQLVGEEKNIKTKYNSIRDRICNINADYFEALFEYVFVKFNKELGELKAITKVDSTMTSIPRNLLDWGMLTGNKTSTISNIKYSISMKGSLPSGVKIFSKQSYLSEDIALVEAVLDNSHTDDSIVVIDRGVSSRRGMDKFADQQIIFVVRSRKIFQFLENKSIKLRKTRAPKHSTVKILNDRVGKLQDQHHRFTKNDFRVIEGVIKETNEPIYWITNVLDLSPYEIASIYKQRWEIEVFFKFIKQNLNFKHFVSRSENGIKVMLYMTLITAILIIVYKKKNKISSFKIAKHRFEIELDTELTKEIVILCGGDPAKAPHIFNSS